MRSIYLIPLVLGALVTTVILSQSVLGVGQNGTAKNITPGIVNSTATGNTTSNSGNVTAASGNNGHIYRGGAAAGSGGE